jgi:hypothetical protein
MGEDERNQNTYGPVAYWTLDSKRALHSGQIEVRFFMNRKIKNQSFSGISVNVLTNGTSKEACSVQIKKTVS